MIDEDLPVAFELLIDTVPKVRYTLPDGQVFVVDLCYLPELVSQLMRSYREYYDRFMP